MIHEPAIRWLTQEVEDLLDAGSVGLYELMEFLSGDDFDLTDEQNREVALAVTREIALSGRAEIYELRWPKDVALGPVVDPNSIDLRSFPAEPSEFYLALMPR